jgi:uncharacterized membrane protein HdeD (DUF308 family)
MAIPEAGAHKVLKAAFLGREAILKLAESRGFRFHALYLADTPTCRKGIISFLAPGLTLFAFTLVFAAFCFADGIAMLITGIRRAGSGHAPWWTMILTGLAGIAVGVIFLFWPLLSTLAYAIATVLLVAGWAIVTGALQIAAAIRLREEIEGEWILGLAGLFGVVLGLALITLTALQPTLSILSVAWLIGFYAIMTGVMLLMLGLRLRKRAG